ncbi:MAG: hypothetical protein KDD52_09785, partial [Bdellovibrionales bacterium]|nr:hypothetical protein [Bdellovibrionales bacterium]
TIHLDNCFIGATIFARKELLLALGGFEDARSFEDTRFFLRADKICTVRRINARTYRYYRDTPGSITNTLLERSPRRASASFEERAR